MPELSTTRRVRHAAAEMFDLVADVERYPEFVPLCQSLTVRERKQEGGKDIIVADMTVAYKLVRQTFTSRVTLDRPNLQILVRISRRAVSPAQQHLEIPTGRGAGPATSSFSSPTSSKAARLGMLMGAMFDTAFRRFAAAFERRADEVYGTRAA